MAFKTEQEKFWAGNFGDAYIERNQNNQRISNNTALFAKIFSSTRQVESVIEFGANVGLNLMAIRRLLPEARLSAIEINEKAAQILQENVPDVSVTNASILDTQSDIPVSDLVLIKGVLIHINPEQLSSVYESLYKACGKYICIAEYYNPTPVSIDYRGHSDRLFKRDFAGEMLDSYSDLELIDYGFVYHRDGNFPQDDTTWFLLEKLNA